MLAFSPMAAAGVSLAGNSDGGSVALGSAGSVVVVTNIGANDCFIELGNSSVSAALTSGMIVPTDRFRVLQRSTVGSVHTHLGAICAAGETCTLYISLGEGVIVA